MKKILSVLAGITLLASTLQATFAYTLSSDDTAIVDRATSVIEKSISKKGENYRARYLRALKALKLRYTTNERLYTIINKTISNLGVDSNGCLIPSGYSWCEATQKCIRTWEESCENAQAPQFVSLEYDEYYSPKITVNKEILFYANIENTRTEKVKFVINWGDGTKNTEDTIDVYNAPATYDPRHTYTTPGKYTIEGTVTSLSTNLSSSIKLIIIVN